MGIVNVTPDSFSDGGKFFDPATAVAHALELADQGADILDIGGESTRPYSDPVSDAEELRRVVPVIEQVCRRTDVPVSVDTSKASVARAAIEQGAEIINDVTGLEGDERMLAVALETGAGVCAMHMQGTPQTMQDAPAYANVLEEIHDYLAARRDSLLAAGIVRERICLDPGIGFGKTHQHNLDLLAGCARLLDLGCPILIGHSRKGFVGKLLGDKDADRLYGTIGAALAVAAHGAQVVRVHDVRAVREALELFAAAGGIDGRAARIEE
ncbi:MAG: dihydropteroate synthase [Planctomycetales bacterium]|nr:dihydropteroate synthase [Planctomycetales bacterium]